MSLKDRFANHSDTTAEQPLPEEQKSVELYDTAGHARNICFVQESGVMTFLNYAYLISGQYNPETSVITLGFTTHLVVIKGCGIDSVFAAIIESKARKIIQINNRYLEIQNARIEIISEIEISKIENG